VLCGSQELFKPVVGEALAAHYDVKGIGQVKMLFEHVKESQPEGYWNGRQQVFPIKEVGSDVLYGDLKLVVSYHVMVVLLKYRPNRHWTV
jgi:hypothetical protein